MRRSLAASYMLAEILREQEFWDEAEVAYDEVVKRSLAMKEPFFLQSARTYRAICLKQSGKKA